MLIDMKDVLSVNIHWIYCQGCAQGHVSCVLLTPWTVVWVASLGLCDATGPFPAVCSALTQWHMPCWSPVSSLCPLFSLGICLGFAFLDWPHVGFQESSMIVSFKVSSRVTCTMPRSVQTLPPNSVFSLCQCGVHSYFQLSDHFWQNQATFSGYPPLLKLHRPLVRFSKNSLLLILGAIWVDLQFLEFRNCPCGN